MYIMESVDRRRIVVVARPCLALLVIICASRAIIARTYSSAGLLSCSKSRIPSRRPQQGRRVVLNAHALMRDADTDQRDGGTPNKAK